MSYRGKVVLLGAPSVGKTSLLARYVDGNFMNEYVQTVGANFLVKEVDLKNIIHNIDMKTPSKTQDIEEKGFKLYFWDIGGQTDKLFANEYYFIQAVGALAIFSLNNRSSFEQIDFWIQKLKELSGDIPYIMVGNKSDLERAIDKDEITTKKEKFGCQYFETSAKMNTGVKMAFEALSIQILNKIK